MPDPAHILVVDDDDRLRDLLRRYLTDQGFIVSVAADAKEARACLQRVHVDLIVLDVMMPGETGLSLTASLRQTGQAVPILLLTARTESNDRIDGLEAGADDYLPKPFEPRELVLRINAILRRAALPPQTPPAEIRMGRWIFDPDRGELRAPIENETLRLTDSEAKLLRLLSTRPGTVFRRDDLITESGADLNARTIDVQITRLRRKIEDDPRQPQWLQTVRGEGYLLRVGS
jgi:two-component system, OmpR family, phosphate regulon response regulator OmpR